MTCHFAYFVKIILQIVLYHNDRAQHKNCFCTIGENVKVDVC